MMSRLNIFSIAVIVLGAFLIVDVAAFGSGAPEGACEAARPWHTHSADGNTTSYFYSPLPASQNPYSFIVDTSKYVPGESLQVTIRGTAQDKIYGFFLQARLYSDNSSIGAFDDDDLPTGSQLRPCESTADAVTHTNSGEKDDLTFTWTAPDTTDLGSMRFVGAVALNHDDFYVGIESAEVMEGEIPTQATTTSAASASLRVSFGVLLLSLLVAAFTKIN